MYRVTRVRGSHDELQLFEPATKTSLEKKKKVRARVGSEFMGHTSGRTRH